jgi:hypothetical protein
MLIFHVISLFFLDGTGRRGKLKFILNQISEVEILAERTGLAPKLVSPRERFSGESKCYLRASGSVVK